MISLKVDLTEATKNLDLFAKHVNAYVIRRGAQSAAQLFYDEARRLAPVADRGHVFYGRNQKYFFPAGTLKASIYQVFSKDRSTDGIATYQISWNHKKAPYGFMVEYGTSRAPAHPFMRPAWDRMKDRVGEAARGRMADILQSGQAGLL